MAASKYPDNVPSALAGERLPIAKVPADVPFRPGDENGYAGRARFCRLRYGHYLIGMNASPDKTSGLTVPADFASARNLSTSVACKGVKQGESTVSFYGDAVSVPAVTQGEAGARL